MCLNPKNIFDIERILSKCLQQTKENKKIKEREKEEMKERKERKRSAFMVHAIWGTDDGSYCACL